MFKQNEGTTDRIIRVILGIVVLVIGYVYLDNTAQIVSYVIGAAALITGAVGYCGLYSLFGISTCPVKK